MERFTALLCDYKGELERRAQNLGWAREDWRRIRASSGGVCACCEGRDRAPEWEACHYGLVGSERRDHSFLCDQCHSCRRWESEPEADCDDCYVAMQHAARCHATAVTDSVWTHLPPDPFEIVLDYCLDPLAIGRYLVRDPPALAPDPQTAECIMRQRFERLLADFEGELKARADWLGKSGKDGWIRARNLRMIKYEEPCSCCGRSDRVAKWMGFGYGSPYASLQREERMFLSFLCGSCYRGSNRGKLWRRDPHADCRECHVQMQRAARDHLRRVAKNARHVPLLADLRAIVLDYYFDPRAYHRYEP